MSRLRFFLRHAIVHLSRERQRTIFVLFCIAAGVAAVVSLRTLGLLIGETLTRDLQRANRGDLAIGLPSQIGTPDGAAEEEIDRHLFDLRGDPSGVQEISLSSSGEARLLQWASARGYEAMPFWTSGGPFVRVYEPGSATAASTMLLCVDPQRYPYYGSVRVLQPAGGTLAQALSEPGTLAISDELAAELGLEIGDAVHLTGAAGTMVVSAIVDRRSEANPTDILSTVFTFAYLPYQTCSRELRKRPNTYYLRVPAGTDVHAVKQEILDTFRGLQPTTTEDLRQVNREFSEALARLATAMGLISLLIGGIGIANTMTVVVTHRTLEIAVLKTVGVQGSQVSLMFLVEALFLGTAGSLLGLPLGLGLVLLLRRFAEGFVAQSVPFAVYPEALGMGLLLGILVTLAFGLLPTLSAGRVRPNLVLRPADGALPRSGGPASLLVLAGLAGVMGLVVGQILGDALLGLVAAYATVLGLGLALLLMRGLVWLIGHLPSFGIVSLKLAQRAMDTQRGRVASTLLALVAGITCLSLIALLVQGTLQLVSDIAPTFLGGNILVTAQTWEDGKNLERKIARLPGLSYVHDTVYTAEIVAINGNHDVDALEHKARARAGGANALGDPDAAIDRFLTSFSMKVLDENTWPYQVAEGQDIATAVAAGAVPSDRNRILLEPSLYDDTFAWFDLKAGDTLTLRFPGGATRTATIAGITAPHNAGFLLQGLVEFRHTYGIVPPRFVPRDEPPWPSAYVLTVPDERLDETLDLLAGLPGIYWAATDQFLVYTERAARHFVPLPLIVSALALFASGTIMANTVSLATLERRRQIGIMKAIGLQAEVVLGLLLLENGLVGLAGGLIGTGLSALLVLPSGLLGGGSLPGGALALLVMLAVGLALGATLLGAYGASRERPLNVLRYE